MKFKSGTVGWLLLVALVFGWDYGVAVRCKGETMSSAFRRASRHPLSRWPVVIASVVTAGHLYGWIPVRVDPFMITARILVRNPNV